MNERRDDEGFSELSAAYLEAAKERDDEPVEQPEVPSEEPSAEEAPVEEPSAPEAEVVAAGGWRRWVVPLVVFLLVASNVTFAVLLWRAVDRQEAAVEGVAERFVANLVTFSFRTLDADIERIQADATGTFQRQFDTALGGDVAVFRDAIREAEAESTGQVRGAVVTSIDGESATVLVVAEQTIRNREVPDARTVERIIELTLVHTADGWKVNDVTTLGNGG